MKLLTLGVSAAVALLPLTLPAATEAAPAELLVSAQGSGQDRADDFTGPLNVISAEGTVDYAHRKRSLTFTVAAAPSAQNNPSYLVRTGSWTGVGCAYLETHRLRALTNGTFGAVRVSRTGTRITASWSTSNRDEVECMIATAESQGPLSDSLIIHLQGSYVGAPQPSATITQRKVRSGAKRTIKVQVRNTGGSTWKNASLKLTGRKLRAPRVQIGNLEAGRSRTVKVRVRATGARGLRNVSIKLQGSNVLDEKVQTQVRSKVRVLRRR